MTAIDLSRRKDALKLDLNGPVDLKRQFDVVMNMGTGAHVFNVAELFKTIHNHTRPGGMMAHGMPFSGLIDHGFFSFNPTFYWDMAAANDYVVMGVMYAELDPFKLIRLDNRATIVNMAKAGTIGRNSLIYAVFRKAEQDADFRIPMQGYYDNKLSADGRHAWETLR